MLRIAVLASHEGTTLQSIIDACAQRRIDGRVVAVISNNSRFGALRRAASAHIETFHLSSVTHSSESLKARVQACERELIVKTLAAIASGELVLERHSS